MLARRLLGNFVNTLVPLYYFEYRLQFVYKRLHKRLYKRLGFNRLFEQTKVPHPKAAGRTRSTFIAAIERLLSSVSNLQAFPAALLDKLVLLQSPYTVEGSGLARLAVLAH
jgi:hypothetical protein